MADSFINNPNERNTSNYVTSAISGAVTIQPSASGFGSYLSGILPDDIATAAGAFSAAMQQIKNISNIPTQKFA